MEVFTETVKRPLPPGRTEARSRARSRAETRPLPSPSQNLRLRLSPFGRKPGVSIPPRQVGLPGIHSVPPTPAPQPPGASSSSSGQPSAADAGGGDSSPPSSRARLCCKGCPAHGLMGHGAYYLSAVHRMDHRKACRCSRQTTSKTDSQTRPWRIWRSGHCHGMHRADSGGGGEQEEADTYARMMAVHPTKPNPYAHPGEEPRRNKGGTETNFSVAGRFRPALYDAPGHMPRAFPYCKGHLGIP